MIGIITRWARDLNAGLDRRGSLRAVALLRIAAGPLILLHLRPFFDLAASGATWSDRFHQPFFEWYPAVGGDAYLILLRICAVAAVLVSMGALTRIATAYVAGFVTYNVFLSVTHFHHNRAFLIILLTGLALLPSGRHLSMDAWLARRRDLPPRGPALLWPLWLMRFEVSIVYGASALSKIIDADWWNGLVLSLRIDQWAAYAADRGVPQWALDVLGSDVFMSWFAKTAVLAELFIAAGLIWRRTRPAAVWVAIGFHLSVQAVAQVQVFSWAGLAALVIWVTPSTRDRRLVVTPGAARGARIIGWAVRWLDWTGRFDVEIREGDTGPALCLFDRPGPDGKPVNRVGAQAARMVLSRLPLTFWPCAPLLLPGVRGIWDRFADRWFEAPGRKR